MLVCLQSSSPQGVLLSGSTLNDLQVLDLIQFELFQSSLCEEIGFFVRLYRYQSALRFKGRVLSRSGVKRENLTDNSNLPFD